MERRVPQGGGAPNGGCVPPSSWPTATDCQGVKSPPTCLACTQLPWLNQQNCPPFGEAKTYLYYYMGSSYCCLSPPT